MRILSRRAICIKQALTRPLYILTLRADELFDVAELARINRSKTDELIGRQRTDICKHVDDILAYLDGEDTLFPNSVLIALNGTLRFHRSRGLGNEDSLAKVGVLEMPFEDSGSTKPAWIVDGQQSALALAPSARRDLPVPVNAFVAETASQQRHEFLRINNTKSLSRGPLTELLPQISVPLTLNLAAKKLPSGRRRMLTTAKGPPFPDSIRRASAPRRSTVVITDMGLVEVLRDRKNNPLRCLFSYRISGIGETTFESIWQIVTGYGCAVRDSLSEAWGRPPDESHLMHGVGVRLTSKDRDELSLQRNHLGNTSRTRRVVANVPICLYDSTGKS